MESRAKILGHPIHQMLVPFPLGLLSMGVIFDGIYLLFGNPWIPTVSYWMIAAGIIGGFVAAPFGLIDWLAIPKGTRAHRVGRLHAVGNGAVLFLFIGSWLHRTQAADAVVPYQPGVLALFLGLLGFGLALVTGWLGGELVDRLSVGVDDGAHLDAPSSLSRRPAGQRA